MILYNPKLFIILAPIYLIYMFLLVLFLPMNRFAMIIIIAAPVIFWTPFDLYRLYEKRQDSRENSQ
ncbi:hypothetical protein ACFFGV_18615 [Pontibacillus salicampi]|uniref:Uncharacterized protein n=1 Tax=Pontibacillus salicampi TaxID=1449801 RepID=A0ABV6LT65_9BACI